MLNTNIIGLYPNTSHLSKRRWGPLNKNSLVVSPPKANKNNMDNMSLISVENVFLACSNFLKD